MTRSEQASEAVGYLVVAREEGARLGEVAHVFFDVASKRISGMTSRNGTFTPEVWFGVDQIEVMGKDVILVKSAASLTAIGKGGVIKGSSLKELRGMLVVTADGRRLGTLVDLEVQSDNWTISELWLNDNQRLPVVAEEIQIGPDQIIVPAEYAAQVVGEKKASPGVLRRLFSSKQDPAQTQEPPA
jgi:sporulation protein YlmC with PRC-barrel domain